MYSYTDHFLSPTARVSVEREDTGDVMIMIEDYGFRCVWFGTYDEAKSFSNQFDALDYHYAWSFPGVTVFDKLEQSHLTDLKFTLEMM